MRCPPLSKLPLSNTDKTGWPWTEEHPQLPDLMPNGQPWPKISIVTPSYNQGTFIEETIRSVLLQGYPNLEYIVMDGGSTDDSVEIIQAYAPHLTHWRSEKDKGQTDAINRGFDISRGKILAWLNSDDVLLPGCLYKVAQYFTDYPEGNCVAGGTIIIDNSSQVIRNRLGLPRIVRGEYETLNSLLLRGGLSFYQAASFWKREAFLAVGGLDDHLVFAMDYDLYLKLARHMPISHLDELLACFRIHSESKTTLLQSIRHEEVDMLRRREGWGEIGTMSRKIWKVYYAIFNIINNLPLRIGVAAGLVTLPYASR